jgi:hypothetical protein
MTKKNSKRRGRPETNKVRAIPQTRPTVVIADDIQQRLNVLREAARGQDDLLQLINETEGMMYEMVQQNKTIAHKHADELEARIMAQYRERMLQQQLERYRNQAQAAGIEDLSLILAPLLDMYHMDIKRVLNLILGKEVDGVTDEIPPYHIAQLRETLEDIARMCLEEEIFEASAEDDIS